MMFRNLSSLNTLVFAIAIALYSGECQAKTLSGNVGIQLNPNTHPIYIHTPFVFHCRFLSQANDFDTCQFEHGPFNVPQIGSYDNITKLCVFPPLGSNKAARSHEGSYKCRVCDSTGDCTAYVKFTLLVREDGGWSRWYRRNECVDEDIRSCNNPSPRNGGTCHPSNWYTLGVYRTRRNCEWTVKEGETSEYRGTTNARLHNHAFPAQTQTFFIVRSRIECAVMCSSDVACKTYTFNPSVRSCVLTLL